MVKLLMNILLTRHSSFYESKILMTQFGVHSGNGIAYLSIRKLYICYVNVAAAYDHIKRNFLFFSIRLHLSSSETAECPDLIEELYQFTKSYMSGDDPSAETFQSPSRVWQGGNESTNLFHLFLDYALCIYK